MRGEGGGGRARGTSRLGSESGAVDREPFAASRRWRRFMVVSCYAMLYAIGQHSVQQNIRLKSLRLKGAAR